MGLPIRIKIPEGFLAPETRSGFFVSEKRKKVWAVQLDLLNELTTICAKNNIKFQVSFGTLLGAIRHKGFIPWDDDFDVWMSREDLDKLISLSNKFKHPYFLQTPLNDRRYACPLTRLRNSLTTGSVVGMNTPDYNNGIYIDIYAMDGLATSGVRYFFQRLLKIIVGELWALRCPIKPAFNSIQNFIRRVFIQPFSLLLPYRYWYYLYVKVVTMWKKSEKLVSLAYGDDWFGKPNWIYKDDLKKSIQIPFEWITVPVSHNYDAILRRYYGNYMEFPPLTERGRWHEGQVEIDPEVPYKEFFALKAKGNYKPCAL